MTIGMNKRFLAKILTLCMIVSMVQLPVSAASADTDTAPATGTGISWSVESDGIYKVNDDVTVSGTYTVGNDANGTYVIALDTDTGNTETYSLTMDTIVVASDSKLTVKGGAVKAYTTGDDVTFKVGGQLVLDGIKAEAPVVLTVPSEIKNETKATTFATTGTTGKTITLTGKLDFGENGVTVKDGATVIIKSDEHSIGNTTISGTITVEEGAVLKIQSNVTLNSDIIVKGTIEVAQNVTVSGNGEIVLDGGNATGDTKNLVYKISVDTVSNGSVNLAYQVGNDTTNWTKVELVDNQGTIPVGSTVKVTATPNASYKVENGTYKIGNDASAQSIPGLAGIEGEKVNGTFTPNGSPIVVDVDFVKVTSGGGDHGGGGGGGGGGGSSSSSSRVTVASTTHGRVTVSPDNPKTGDTVTITVRPDNGYVLDTLTVTNASGKEVELTKVNDTRYTFVMPNSKVTVKATFVAEEPSGMPFTDVASGAWYYDAVSFVYKRGLMAGTGDNLFSPNVTTSRGMIVTILYRLDGSPSASSAGFTDVASGQWYTDAVNWAAANDIVAGYGNSLFGPNDTVTREQMAVILYRYAQYKGYDTSASNSLNGYTDVGGVSSWALTAMQWANAEGLINGTSGTTLSPTNGATRAEVAQILMRFCENFVD